MDLASFGRKGLVTALKQDLGELKTKRGRGIRGTRSGLTPLQMQRLVEKLREAQRSSEKLRKKIQFIWLDHGLGFRMPTYAHLWLFQRQRNSDS